jgi:hypothetical protein
MAAPSDAFEIIVVVGRTISKVERDMYLQCFTDHTVCRGLLEIGSDQSARCSGYHAVPLVWSGLE